MRTYSYSPFAFKQHVICSRGCTTLAQTHALSSHLQDDERRAARNGFDGLNPVIQPESISAQYRFLPKNPMELIKEGNFNKVPTIHGTNKNEGSFIFGCKLQPHKRN